MSGKQGVQVLPGVGGIKAVYEMSLAAKQIDSICTSEAYDTVLEGYFDGVYMPKLEASGIQSREILAQGDAQSGPKSESVRFVPREAMTETDVVIFDNQVGLISFDAENPYAVLINDPEMMKGFKARFELLWKSLG